MALPTARPCCTMAIVFCHLDLNTARGMVLLLDQYMHGHISVLLELAGTADEVVAEHERV